MGTVLTFLAIRQDYFWFAAIVLWAIAAGLYYKSGCVPHFRWVIGTAAAMGGVAITEWAMFAHAVKPHYPHPPHLIGDMVAGAFWALQAFAWLAALRPEWWLRIGTAVTLLTVVAGRWQSPQLGGAILAATTILMAFFWWRQRTSKAARAGQLLATLAACCGPFDIVVGQQRRWTEISQVSAVVALLAVSSAIFTLVALTRALRAEWPAATAEMRERELRWLARWGAVWLVAGFGLALVSGWSAQRMFEQSVLARARVAATMIDLELLGQLLGPDMHIERPLYYRRPTGQVTQYAHVDYHATEASQPIRKILRKIRSDPDVVETFIATSREGKLVLCLNPFEDPKDWSYVTLQGMMTASDLSDWQTHRGRFEVRLNTTYNEIAIARVPLVQGEHRMLGWLELDIPASFWVAPQATAHLQAIFAVILGLGVLGSWALQRWRSHEREFARREAAVAREADAMKSVFMAKVSHELRTPLQSILGYGDLLRASVLESDQRRHLDALVNQGNMLSRLVDDLIDLGAIEAGTVRFQLQPVALPTLVIEAAESLRPQAERKGLGFAVHSSGATDSWVWADPHRVRQVLANLLGNAIKFTAQGRVEVWFAGSRCDSVYSVELQVIDTGPGISPTEQGRLFRPFTRLAGTEHVEGAGLGLAIAAELCRRMGGEITVASNGHLGSTFRVTLAFAIATPPAGGKSAGAAPARLVGHRVLIADDNAFVRELFSEYLTGLGAKCDVVPDGLAAVHEAATSAYTAIVLDVMMPGLDGNAAARRIKQEGASRTARLIAASAHAALSDDDRGEFDVHLSKPVPLATLGRAIAPDAAMPVAGPTTLLELMEKFGARFRTEAPIVTANLLRAVEERRWDDVRTLAHHTKNSADVLDDRDLARKLGVLELAAERRDAPLIAMSWTQCEVALRTWFTPREPFDFPAPNRTHIQPNKNQPST